MSKLIIPNSYNNVVAFPDSRKNRNEFCCESDCIGIDELQCGFAGNCIFSNQKEFNKYNSERLWIVFKIWFLRLRAKK